MLKVPSQRTNLDFIDSTADCFVPWPSPTTMDMELPALTDRLESLPTDPKLADESGDAMKGKMPKNLDVKLPMDDIRPHDNKGKNDSSKIAMEAKGEETKNNGSYVHQFQEMKRPCLLPEGVNNKTPSPSHHKYSEDGDSEIEGSLLRAVDETVVNDVHNNYPSPIG